MKTDFFQVGKQIYNTNKEKGFWDNRKRDVPSLLQALGLIQSEFFEAFEALRKNKFCKVTTIPTGAAFDVAYFTKHVKDTYQDELSDVAIRILDLLIGYGIEEKQLDDSLNYWETFLFYQDKDKVKSFEGGQKVAFLLESCTDCNSSLFPIVCSSIIDECLFFEPSLFERFFELFKPKKSEFERRLNKSFHILILILAILRNNAWTIVNLNINWKLQYNKTREKMHGKKF
jgi:NTP pyrophosphatase (non-canonical NTP hydrolase)